MEKMVNINSSKIKLKTTIVTLPGIFDREENPTQSTSVDTSKQRAKCLKKVAIQNEAKGEIEVSHILLGMTTSKIINKKNHKTRNVSRDTNIFSIAKQRNLTNKVKVAGKGEGQNAKNDAKFLLKGVKKQKQTSVRFQRDTEDSNSAKVKYMAQMVVDNEIYRNKLQPDTEARSKNTLMPQVLEEESVLQQIESKIQTCTRRPIIAEEFEIEIQKVVTGGRRKCAKAEMKFSGNTQKIGAADPETMPMKKQLRYKLFDNTAARILSDVGLLNKFQRKRIRNEIKA